MAERTLIIVGGPTASGKTDAGIALARHCSTEVISADSRQFYHAMRIGTARPLEHELVGVRHHFLGHLKLDETWSAGRFAREAEPVLQELLNKHGIAVLVGGSGLYIDALVKGLDPLPASDPRLRERLQRRIDTLGLADLLHELERHDPATAARIDASNPHRVLRALEVCLLTGKPYSEQRTDASDRTDMRIVRIAMDVPREELYARIDARVDRMMTEGLLEEARSLLPHRDLNALQTVGYKELFLHFDGQLSLADAVALIKQHSRNYAKRQVTWLRRDAEWRWVAPSDLAAMIAHVEQDR
ncbi:MAG TPA: tRNA (adenosine(37)-N6)-dimethylallyltransferase MiaA [Flavobacteriales bacterium]|nr:tRNA (adenosine(37)-N6)-dimethylallyltransferase MiaA [Flavobacteriales bacterium]